MTVTFIETWEKEVSDQLCDDLINWFEDFLIKEPNKFHSDGKNNLFRKDINVDLMQSNNPNLIDPIIHHVTKRFEEYKNIYGQLKKDTHILHNNLKFQRTLPYGGFHSWHYELGSKDFEFLREAVWTIYLNDMPPHEAETEFLYQNVKVRPEKGKLCIFPAAMTHVHRGLTVYTQPKYIITGWFLKYVEDLK